MQPDPELAEGPASGAKVAMFAIAIAVVLGAVFYGLNNTSINQAGTAPPAQTAQTQPASPAAPPGMRDVTPRNNDRARHDHGCRDQPPDPAAGQPAGTELDRSANPPADKSSSEQRLTQPTAQRVNSPAAFRLQFSLNILLSSPPG